MDGNFRLSKDDVNIKTQDSLDLFYAGIKADQTRTTMDRLLKKFLLEACADILHGNYRKRADEFVNLAKTEPTEVTNIVIAYVKQLKKRTQLPKDHKNYINPSYLPNKIKPIKKLVVMNDVTLPWHRIRSYYPELDNTHKGRGYTRDEIKKLLEYSDSIDSDFIVLASSSGGLRVGAWSKQTWGNIFPIYQINEEYKIELEAHEQASTRIVCAGMVVYKGTREEYIALVSIEAWSKLQEYKKVWTKKIGHTPANDDPLILARYANPTPLTYIGVKSRIENLVVKAGLRDPKKLRVGVRRHEVPTTHGFRRYWDKVMMQTQRNKGTLSALVSKERLFGHTGIVKTDKNYYWTDILELVPEYLEAMPELMINDEVRLQNKLDNKIKENQILENANQQRKIALERLAELEAKVNRMQIYQKVV
jgi:integrase